MLLKQKYTSEELYSMDSWRGILSVLVFIAHLAQIFWYPLIGTKGYTYIIIGTMANASVVCFFMLSGILISYSAANLTEQNKFNWKKYVINRFTRIYPSFLVVVLMCFVLVLIFPYLNGGTHNIVRLDSDKYIARVAFYCSPIEFVYAIFMLVSDFPILDGPLWSLIIEWWLYFFGMFLFMIIATKPTNKILYIVWFILALRALMYNYHYNQEPTIYYAAIWLTGFLYTLYFRNNKSLVRIFLYFSLLSVIIMVFISGVQSINIAKSKPYLYGVFQIFVAMLFLNFMFKIKLPKIFNKMAKHSYTLYIIHFPLCLVIFSLTRKLANNNPYILGVETLCVFFIIIFISKLTAKYTENKTIFRDYLYKLNDKLDSIFVKNKV